MSKNHDDAAILSNMMKVLHISCQQNLCEIKLMQQYNQSFGCKGVLMIFKYENFTGNAIRSEANQIVLCVVTVFQIETNQSTIKTE